jgi:inward rectifier potassium channel
LHYYFITISWLKFFIFFIFSYLIVNVIFTLSFCWIGLGKISGINHQSKYLELIDTFFFSVQIVSTNGFTDARSLDTTISFMATRGTIIGLFFIVLMTGLLYTRFSRPTAKMIYSKQMLIGTHHNKKALMVRVANFK